MQEDQRFLVEQLRAIGSIHVNLLHPYQWASGWLSPMYCDNRRILAHPSLRGWVAKALGRTVQQYFPAVEALVGVATGGIAIGALAAQELGLPFGYVRASAKAHGLTNQVEGGLREGLPVVVIEDLISTGGSSLSAVEALRAAGFRVLGMVAIFSYDFPQAREAFSNSGVELHTLASYPVLLDYLKEQGELDGKQLAYLEQWRREPAQWGR